LKARKEEKGSKIRYYNYEQYRQIGNFTDKARFGRCHLKKRFRIPVTKMSKENQVAFFVNFANSQLILI